MERYLCCTLKGELAYKHVAYITTSCDGIFQPKWYTCELCDTGQMRNYQCSAHCHGDEHIANYHRLKQMQEEKRNNELEAGLYQSMMTRINHCNQFIRSCPKNFPSAENTIKALSYDFINTHPLEIDVFTDKLQYALIKFRRRERLALLELGLIKLFYNSRSPTINSEGNSNGMNNHSSNNNTLSLTNSDGNVLLPLTNTVHTLRISKLHIIIALVARFL